MPLAFNQNFSSRGGPSSPRKDDVSIEDCGPIENIYNKFVEGNSDTDVTSPILTKDEYNNFLDRQKRYELTEKEFWCLYSYKNDSPLSKFFRDLYENPYESWLHRYPQYRIYLREYRDYALFKKSMDPNATMEVKESTIPIPYDIMPHQLMRLAALRPAIFALYPNFKIEQLPDGTEKKILIDSYEKYQNRFNGRPDNSMRENFVPQPTKEYLNQLYWEQYYPEKDRKNWRLYYGRYVVPKSEPKNSYFSNWGRNNNPTVGQPQPQQTRKSYFSAFSGWRRNNNPTDGQPQSQQPKKGFFSRFGFGGKSRKNKNKNKNKTKKTLQKQKNKNRNTNKKNNRTKYITKK